MGAPGEACVRDATVARTVNALASAPDTGPGKPATSYWQTANGGHHRPTPTCLCPPRSALALWSGAGADRPEPSTLPPALATTGGRTPCALAGGPAGRRLCWRRAGWMPTNWTSPGQKSAPGDPLEQALAQLGFVPDGVLRDTLAELLGLDSLEARALVADSTTGGGARTGRASCACCPALCAGQPDLTIASAPGPPTCGHDQLVAASQGTGGAGACATGR